MNPNSDSSPSKNYYNIAISQSGVETELAVIKVQNGQTYHDDENKEY